MSHHPKMGTIRLAPPFFPSHETQLEDWNGLTFYQKRAKEKSFSTLTWCCSWTWGSNGGSWCSGGVPALHSRARCTLGRRGLERERMISWNFTCGGKNRSFHKDVEGGTLKSCNCGSPVRSYHPTVVLLCELLVGVSHYFCGARLFASEDVWVHRGAIQHQRPLLQFACSNDSIVSKSKVHTELCYKSDTLNRVFDRNKMRDFISLAK